MPLGRSDGVTRRTLALVVVLVLAVAGTAGGWLALRSSGGVTGLCTSQPTGFKERSIPKTGVSEATVVLTNFRFGRMDDLYGLDNRLHWPLHGVMIAVSNEGPDSTPPFRQSLRAVGADLQGFEGLKWPAANVAVRSEGRILDAYVEIRKVTPATIATVNSALASVRVCHA